MTMSRLFPCFMLFISVTARAVDAQLDPSYYNRHLVPQVIHDATAQRDAAYLAELAQRRRLRLDGWRDSADQTRNLQQHLLQTRRRLLDSLGLYGPDAQPLLRSSVVWNWRKPWTTSMRDVKGQSVPRTGRGSYGMMEQVEIASPFGPDVSALLLRGRDLEPPCRIVICLPDVDPITNLAGRKENLAGDERCAAFLRAGLLPVAADLPALRDLSERDVKKGLVLGEPVLGRIAAELSLLVSYLRTRADVDADRIAVHGRGLGGFAAALAAAIDPRIAAVVVEDGLPSFESIIRNGGELEGPWLVPNFLQYLDGGDLAALIAPRPMMVIASDSNGRWTDGLNHAKEAADLTYATYGTTAKFAGHSNPQDTNVIARFIRDRFEAPKIEFDWPPIGPGPHSQPISITQIHTIEQWREAQRLLKTNVAQLLGGFPDRGNDHSATVIERGTENDFEWERIIVRTTPHTLMPVLITRSENVPPRAPAVVHISGYSISYDADALKLAGELAERGIVGVFACPKTATGFRLGGTPRDAIGILEGRPIVGQWAWNLMGLVDYLQTRPDIDPNRIGAMGWSLGTTTITYWIPFDDRVRAAAGFVAFNQMRGLFDAVRDETVSRGDNTSYLEGHPLFNYVPQLLRYGDADDLLATFAPRPLISLAGKQDEYFPWRVVQNIHDRQHGIYELLDAADRHELLIYDGPHAMADPLREKAWAFFERWFE